MEKFFRDGVVRLGAQYALDALQNGNVFERGFTEQHFASEDVGFGEGRAFASDFDVAFFQCRKTKHGGGFDDRQQVIDIHRQRLGETVNIVATALVVEKLEQSGDAAGTGVR